MLRTATAIAIASGLAVVACRHETDPGFEIVRVPLSAYATPDGGRAPDAAASKPDAGAGPLVVCVAPQKSDDDEDEDTSDECPPRRDGRNYDPRVTTRHRDRGEDGVCCYRRGRLPAGDD